MIPVSMKTNTDCGPIALKNYLKLQGVASSPLYPSSFPNCGALLDNLWDHPYNHWCYLDTFKLPHRAIGELLLCVQKNKPWVWHWVLWNPCIEQVHNGFYWESMPSFKKRYWVIYKYDHSNKPWRPLWTLYGKTANLVAGFLGRLFRRK